MNEFPILLLDNFFLFPKCENYLLFESNIYWKKVILQAWKDCQGYLLIIPNKEKFAGNSKNFAPIGTLAKINLDIATGTDLEPIINSLKEIQLRGLERVKITNLEKKGEIWHGNYQILPEKELDEKTLDELTEKFVRHLPDILEKSKLSSVEKLPYMTMMRGNVSNLIDFITQNSREIDQLTKWKILVSLDLQERLEILISLPDRQKIEKDIEDKTREAIKSQQEEYYLREKLKTIERKLRKKGTYGSNEMRKYLERLEKEPYPDYVKKVIQEEIERYESMPGNSSEANIIKQYVEWLVSLPWHQKTKEINDLEFARRKLNEKHYGLLEIKEKIMKYLAAQQKANKSLGQVICLVGPPGVGKTSLAAAIAEATGRKLVRISLAGIRDVAEVQGHRRTYIAAMPGRIIQAMKEAQVINPLLLIDEIDKISHDYHGDPAYALLQVLDPNQNKRFVDNYLGQDLPYNLSEVMFICTANDEHELPPPLLDRMEVIRLSSYTENEKFHIAEEYLIPENLKKYNLSSEEIAFADQTILDIIRNYTREAGVRDLNRQIRDIIEKYILNELEQKRKEETENSTTNQLIISPENLKDYLKKKKYEFTQAQKGSRVGAVNGLAYTSYGGDVLPIEVAYYPRKEGDFELTGNLGDIMKESARVALNYIKSNHEKFGIDPEVFSQNSIHIHAPEGATPKEGPSAGIALTSAIISVLTDQVIPRDIGMTGEITLHGHVEAIGGLKEKAIAACRSELKTIIIPKSNEKDIVDIPEEVRQKLKIILVEEYQEVWEIIFGKKHQKPTLPLGRQPRKKAKQNVSIN